jgi:hypothetical protein
MMAIVQISIVQFGDSGERREVDIPAEIHSWFAVHQSTNPTEPGWAVTHWVSGVRVPLILPSRSAAQCFVADLLDLDFDWRFTSFETCPPATAELKELLADWKRSALVAKTTAPKSRG